MKRITSPPMRPLFVLVVLFMLSFTRADDSPLRPILAERSTKRAAMVVAYREAKEADRDTIYKDWQKADKELAAKLYTLALTHSERPDSFEFLVTMVIQKDPAAAKAAEAIRTQHVDKPHAGANSNLRHLAGVKSGEELVELIEAKNPNPYCRAAAAFALGEAAKARLDDRASTTRIADRDKARAAFQRAVTHAVGTDEETKSIVRLARGHLAGLENLDRLIVGKAAPELEGIDTAGKPIALRDFKDQVILLDFWSFWCDSCVQLIPHQRELVKRFNGKPFVVLGVNGDLEYGDEYNRNVEKFKVTWRSFKNDPGDDRPKISDAWNVDGWPTLYLIDSKGIIRKKWLGGPKDLDELDREIEKCLAEIRK